MQDPLIPRREKPLSPRRAREFRDRWLKKMFGDRKKRAERYARLVAAYNKGVADAWQKREYRYKPSVAGD